MTHHQQIQELIHKVEYADACSDLDALQTLNKQLFDLCDELHDETGILISQYFTCSALFDKVEFDECERKLLELVPLLEKTDESLFLLRSYNLLAVMASECVNYFESLTYYVKAQHIANLHLEYNYQCKILNNMGKLFIELNEYESALSLLIQAYEAYQAMKLQSSRIVTTILLNIIECFGCLGRYEDAQQWVHTYSSFDEKTKRIIHYMLLANTVKRNFDIQAYDEVRTTVHEMIEHASSEDDYVYFFNVYLSVLRILIQMKDKDLCDAVMNQMDLLNNAKPKGTKIASFLYEYVGLKVDYFQCFYHKEEVTNDLYALLEEYVTYSTQIVQQLKNTYTHSMIVQLEKKQVETDKQLVMNENKILEESIQLDEFTGLYNKKSIKSHIDDYIVQHKNEKSALLVLDVDHFKTVNDTYGHDIGDEVLLEVAALLKRNISKDDMVGRFGGDEFILFLTGYAKGEHVMKFCDTLVKQGRKIIIPTTQDQHITFSIGAIHTECEDDFDVLFRKADNALYDRKHHGRDGFTLFE